MPTPKLAGRVEPAPNRSKGFDADTRLSGDLARIAYEQGYRFCIRYLSLEVAVASTDLTHEEANLILDAGLALMAVQHVPYPGWPANGSLGTQHGKSAAINADNVGLPPGVNIWCDLEGIGAVSAQSVIDYCNNWYDEVASFGYVPGLYVGFDTRLSGEQLYYDLKFKHYWRSQSEVPQVAVRSYQMLQGPTITMSGTSLQIDPDTTYIDNENGQPIWLIR